jgi:hypothetical protein
MLLLALVAVGTLVEPRQADREVAAALALTGVRDAPLRNTHGLSWLLSGYASDFGERVVELLVMAAGSCAHDLDYVRPTGECSRSGAGRRPERERAAPARPDAPVTGCVGRPPDECVFPS